MEVWTELAIASGDAGKGYGGLRQKLGLKKLPHGVGYWERPWALDN